MGVAAPGTDVDNGARHVESMDLESEVAVAVADDAVDEDATLELGLFGMVAVVFAASDNEAKGEVLSKRRNMSENVAELLPALSWWIEGPLWAASQCA